MPANIVVIGSVNMDLVCRVDRMPTPGQTILGDDFQTIPGGKGANQAVAAARLGAGHTKVHLIARIGDDEFGKRLLTGLRENHVETSYVRVTRDTPSGVAMIFVDRKGENSIVVAPGANAKLSPADVSRAEPLIRSAAAVVMQLELPYPTVIHAIRLCNTARVPCILDPAPAPAKMPAEMFHVDVLTPNESEASALMAGPSLTKPRDVAIELLSRGARSVVLKLGARGSLCVDRGGQIVRGEAFKVRVVDTTAAGDAFTAALAVARARGMDTRQTLRFANAAGALCCTKFGAQPSLPTCVQVARLLRAN